MEKVRINKYLRECGVGSRRKVEELIAAKKVSINGVIVTELSTQVLQTDEVFLNGKKITPIQETLYYLLNKPKGTLCSHKKRKGEKTIYDLFPKSPPLFSVGRLDKDTTGLIIVTNDGNFANQVIHPSSNIIKEYVATIKEKILPHHIQAIETGTEVENTFVKPFFVQLLDAHTIKICVKEGKKREVRILIKNSHLFLKTLKRTKIGNLALGSLKEGEYRFLTESDRKKIWTPFFHFEKIEK